MATATTSFVFTNVSDATFRAWGSWMSARFTAFGWVNVSQVFATGTNWTDVTTPTAANTARVTEIWRMADTHQGAAPLYIQIDYGETATTDSPGFRIRFGTGASGSTLTGQFADTTATYWGPSVINANAVTCYASGDTDRIAFAMSVTGTGWATGNIMGFTIERRYNSGGTAQATGWTFIRWGGTSTRSTWAFKQDGTTPTAIFSTIMMASGCSAQAELTFDNKVCVTPVLFILGTMEIGLNMVFVPAALYGAGTTFTVDVLGTTRTYITINEGSIGTPITGSAAIYEPAIRYE